MQTLTPLACCYRMYHVEKKVALALLQDDNSIVWAGMVLVLALALGWNDESDFVVDGRSRNGGDERLVGRVIR